MHSAIVVGNLPLLDRNAQLLVLGVHSCSMPGTRGFGKLAIPSKLQSGNHPPVAGRPSRIRSLRAHGTEGDFVGSGCNGISWQLLVKHPELALLLHFGGSTEVDPTAFNYYSRSLARSWRRSAAMFSAVLVARE